MTKTPTLVTPHRATTSTVAHRSDEAFNRHNCRETTFLFQWNVAILVSDRTEFAVAQSEERRRSFELGGDVVFQTTRPCRPWRAIWAAPQWTSCSTWPTWNPPCSWRHCRTWKRIDQQPIAARLSGDDVGKSKTGRSPGDREKKIETVVQQLSTIIKTFLRPVDWTL